MKTPRVLVVDDEEQVREILQRLLSLHGYEVELACDGAQALDLLRGGSFALVLLDCFMPKVSGLDVAAAVRTSPRLDGLKILMVTHDSVTKDVDQAYESGVDGYIVKPFDFAKLLMKVESTLGIERPKP